MTRWIRTMVENLSPCPSLPLLSTFVPSSPPFNPVGRRRLCMKRNKRKRTLVLSSLLPLTFLDRQHSITASYLLSAQLHSPYLSTPSPPWHPLFNRSPGLRHSRGTGRSSLCASLGGCLRACGLSCASAWLTGWGSTPGRWCIGRARRRCGCAGAWSWPSSPWIAGGTACTRMASHLRMTGRGWRQHLC